MATDYHEELCRWLNEDYSKEQECTMQLPFTQPSGGQNAGVKDEEKERLRREKQGRRLQEINCKKLQEKVRWTKKESGTMWYNIWQVTMSQWS